jgi:hypothetical protein
MAFENEASRLRKLAQNPNVLFIWTNHAEVEREKDSIAKIDVENWLEGAQSVWWRTNVGKKNGEQKEQTLTAAA